MVPSVELEVYKPATSATAIAVAALVCSFLAIALAVATLAVALAALPDTCPQLP